MTAPPRQQATDAAPAAGAAGTPAAAGDAARLARALVSLAATFETIGAHLDAHAGERCPYRTGRNLCTFHGGCQNQRRGARAAGDLACGGDGQLQWTPAVEGHASSWPDRTGCRMPDVGCRTPDAGCNRP